ncbi:MAG: tRNA (N6-threonylcarbamoyladenosine(37)-N6)-methyltransferase TrmO [Clostridia bacterium]|nr:tRNA (N6-threonylcarbamoyladenosine(37)-N6)-methyltransferase TrmO [Clostridia bacterium]
MKIIARIHNDFKEKFGIPRQSGILDEFISYVVFEPEYRVREALRGIEGYSHLWLIWEFSRSVREGWSPTVRPPRLGGNKRMGVFATRSPFRPNPIGLSSVRLIEVKNTATYGDVLVVSGADLLDGTPIYDIKPYLSFTDSHPEAVGGFADGVMENTLTVNIPEPLLARLPSEKRGTLRIMLENDPRPSYKAEGERVYTFRFAEYEISFTVDGGILTVTAIEEVT